MSNVTITLPNQLLQQLDQIAKREHRSRSAVIQEAVLNLVVRRNANKRPTLWEKPSVRAAVALQDRTARELQGVKFDSVEFIRKMRGPLK